MVASMSKPSVSIVLGGGHSIWVPIAVLATSSFIVESCPNDYSPYPSYRDGDWNAQFI